MDEWVDGVLARARQAYGDLQHPDDGFFALALAEQPWRPVVDRLREFLTVEEWTDREDGVSFSYVLARPRRRREPAGPVWALWLSAVGPYGLLGYGAAGSELAREEVRIAPFPDGPPEQYRLFDVLLAAGVELLSAEQVELSVPEFRPFRAEPDAVPPPMFVLLFGDEDAPWRHAW
ncbi:hypothetical protein [Kutzneria sp. NPDC052558]|uniref:hypothetical protein n=1 Tax=Kutzneria sp. NPDC052558 TaxID=3364121 RepID=UPI0037C955C1